MRAPNLLLKAAAEKLAAMVSRRQFDTDVTTADAVDLVDHDHVIAWAAIEMGTRSPQMIMLEAFENLTDDDAKTVIACLMNETDTVRKILAEALREYVAKDLAYEAQKILDNYEPTDAEMSPQVWDDPVAADRRKIARASIAAHRTGREAYFDV